MNRELKSAVEQGDNLIEVLMPLNAWANRCGYFYNACLTPANPEDKDFCPGQGPSPNNGYNCRHPKQEEMRDGIGCCYGHSCPLAYQADGVVCHDFGIPCEDCGKEECECDEEMMVCEIADNLFDKRYMYRRTHGEEATK